jgi:hypothetical protein
VKYTCCYSKSALDHYKLDNEGLTDIKGDLNRAPLLIVAQC